MIKNNADIVRRKNLIAIKFAYQSSRIGKYPIYVCMKLLIPSYKSSVAS